MTSRNETVCSSSLTKASPSPVGFLSYRKPPEIVTLLSLLPPSLSSATKIQLLHLVRIHFQQMSPFFVHSIKLLISRARAYHHVTEDFLALRPRTVNFLDYLCRSSSENVSCSTTGANQKGAVSLSPATIDAILSCSRFVQMK